MFNHYITFIALYLQLTHRIDKVENDSSTVTNFRYADAPFNYRIVKPERWAVVLQRERDIVTVFQAITRTKDFPQLVGRQKRDVALVQLYTGKLR